MKQPYNPRLNREAGTKGSIDGAIATISGVVAVGVTKQLMEGQSPEMENAIAVLVGTAIGSLIGYAKRRLWNWRKNKD